MSSTNTNNDGATGAGVTVAGPTPGPWHPTTANKRGVSFQHSRGSSLLCLLEYYDDMSDEEVCANQQLIAQAPALRDEVGAYRAACTPERLDALDQLLTVYRLDLPEGHCAIDCRALLSDLRAAVIAARGGRTP